jgi:hypothetical protein
MNDDVLISRALDDVLPASAEHGDWQRVLADAGARGANVSRRWLRPRPRVRRPLALGLALAALAVLVPVAALAVSDDWWFLGTGGPPKPAGDVVVVSSGRWAGVPWTLAAYRSRTNGVCVAFTPNSATGRPDPSGAPSGRTSALACGAPIEGLPGLPAGEPAHWLGYLGSFSSGGQSGGFPDFVAGPAAVAVDRVELAFPDREPVGAATLLAPDALGAPLRFFVLPVPAGATPTALVALDAGGKVLERLRLPAAPVQQPGGTSTSGTDVAGP